MKNEAGRAAVVAAMAGRPDWDRIGARLAQSYGDLRVALASENV